MPTFKGKALISLTQTPRRCYFENARYAILDKGIYSIIYGQGQHKILVKRSAIKRLMRYTKKFSVKILTMDEDRNT